METHTGQFWPEKEKKHSAIYAIILSFVCTFQKILAHKYFNANTITCITMPQRARLKTTHNLTFLTDVCSKQVKVVWVFHHNPNFLLVVSPLSCVCHVFPPLVSIFGLFPVLVKCHYELILVQPCLSNYL